MVSISAADEKRIHDRETETASIMEEAPRPQSEEESRESAAEDIPLTEMTSLQLIDKIEQAQAASQKNYDLYVRSQAEIDNLKKRYQKEQQGLVKFANESLIKQLLPVADNLENAIAHSRNEISAEALIEGVDLTLKGLKDVLQKAGVEEVEAAGRPFDPNFHEAVSEVADDRVEPGTVIKELQKGYTLNERLIRPSMVVVSKKTA